jgi:hypothetical protein
MLILRSAILSLVMPFSTDVIWYIDKRRWQWLGNVPVLVRMSVVAVIETPPHRALELLMPSPGSLLVHLNLELRSHLVVAKELAFDVVA